MDDTFFRTMLFDFFGDLLTEKQRDCYDLHYNQDFSLQEIAEQYGTTRQAVWDIIRRGEQSLRQMEEKTGLVAKAVRRRQTLDELMALSDRLGDRAAGHLFAEKLKTLYD